MSDRLFVFAAAFKALSPEDRDALGEALTKASPLLDVLDNSVDATKQACLIDALEMVTYATLNRSWLNQDGRERDFRREAYGNFSATPDTRRAHDDTDRQTSQTKRLSPIETAKAIYDVVLGIKQLAHIYINDVDLKTISCVERMTVEYRLDVVKELRKLPLYIKTNESVIIVSSLDETPSRIQKRLSWFKAGELLV